MTLTNAQRRRWTRAAGDDCLQSENQITDLETKVETLETRVADLEEKLQFAEEDLSLEQSSRVRFQEEARRLRADLRAHDLTNELIGIAKGRSR